MREIDIGKRIIKEFDDCIFLDLERPSDLSKLDNPELFLSAQSDKLICLDEIQRKPEIFPLIRSLVDDWGGNGHFLILGSASVQLLKQSSESLAGRVSYKTLYPFVYEEIRLKFDLPAHMIRGGYPRSLLAGSNESSYTWAQDLITTYVERDLMQWSGVSSTTMYRLWKMLAHLNGQIANRSQLANSLGVSSVTVSTYMDLLTNTFMIRQIQPYLPNFGKRLIKSPKVYIADAGILCGLLSINDYEQLLGHPVFGSLWELLVLNQILSVAPRAILSHYRTSHGNELDFIVEYKSKIFAIECKASKSPKLTKGNLSSISEVDPYKTFVVAPVDEAWPLKENIEVVGLNQLAGIFSQF